jgi:adenylate cyclase
MQLAMASVNERNRDLGLPDVQMGIAVNTGEVVVGNVGSHKRAKYGVVGSPVNLAGRIESYTVGGQILVSEATLRAAGDLEVEGRMTIEAKGFAEPVAIYSLRGLGGDGGVKLPDSAEEMTALPRAIPVTFTVLEGKHGTGLELSGSLVGLSMQGADIRAQGTVEPLRDVRLRVTGFHGTPVPGELYAKVMKADADGGGFQVRFTSVPPEIAGLFKSALAGAAGPA